MKKVEVLTVILLIISIAMSSGTLIYHTTTMRRIDELEEALEEQEEPTGPVAGGVLRIGVQSEAPGLGKAFTGGHLIEVGRGSEPLFEASRLTGEFYPFLCESYDVSEDGLTYTLHIRENVLFQNGHELDATDVYWELGALAGTIPQEELPWPAFQRRYGTGGVLMGEPTVEKIEVVDKYTLKITMKHQVAPGFVDTFLMGLAPSNVGPIDEMFQLGEDFNLHPIFNGPWSFVEWRSAEYMIFDKWEGYWGQEPYLDRVIIKFIPDDASRLAALLTGEIDIAEDLDVDQIQLLEDDPKFNVDSFMSDRIYSVHFNQREARGWPITDPRFRKAVYMAVDWEALMNTIFPGAELFAYESYLKESIGGAIYDPEFEDLIPRYDPVEAENIINDLKAIKEFDHPIQIVAPPMLSRDDVAEFVGLSLMEIGVDVDVRIVEAAEWVRNVKTLAATPYSAGEPGWDITSISVYGLLTDPSAIQGDVYSKAGQVPVDGGNFAGWNSSEVDQLLYDGATSLNDEDRIAVYRELERLYWGNIPFIRLANPLIYFAWNVKVQDFDQVFEADLLAVRLVTPANLTGIPAINVWLKED